MPQSVGGLESPVSSLRLLRSRLGRRLLLQFCACALIPTCLVALLSFNSVTGQLTRQGRERLAALARAAGKTLYDRLAFVEADLRRDGPELLACAASRARGGRTQCGGELLYAAEGLAVVSDGRLVNLNGQSAVGDSFPSSEVPALDAGQSTLMSQSDSAGRVRFLLVHKSDGAADGLLLLRLGGDYLWGASDAEGLPGNASFALLDESAGILLGTRDEADNLSGTARGALTANLAGSFEWRATRRFLAAYSTLVPTAEFRLPPWRVVLSEPRADVIAPIHGFTRTFPIALLLVLLAVGLLSLSQIRRSLVPLAELGSGTRRIASGDFHTPVSVTSGDELEELGGAFNAMTARLELQFHALETAAEIDRAILSSVDTATIAQALLDRLPEVSPCDGASLTVLAPEDSLPGTTWMEPCRGGPRTRLPALPLTQEDRALAQQQPEWVIFGETDTPLPAYLEHFADGDGKAVIACPLHHGGELLGMLALRDCSEERSNEGLLHLRRLADRVAVALSNASMMDQVRVLAFYDSLTKLPNRVLYRERLGQAIGRAQHRKTKVAVCSLDLDHFSRINDTLGHALGDRLVQEVAARLQSLFRQEEGEAGTLSEAEGIQVARLGGDEFTIILPDLAESQEALWVARRLLETFQLPFRLGSQEIFVTASIGVAIYPDDGSDTETLHKHADVALSHAKEEGRNTVELYSASMNAEALGRMQLEAELRRAIDNGEFTLWYQPIVELRSRVTTGAEALVRWNHPERGLVHPADFIGLMEEAGLIVPLGEWTLRRVCEQIKLWEEQGLDPIRMSVNLSARQLRQRGIVRTVQDILDATGVRPGALAIELTESLLMEQGGTTERRIRELAELGLTLAIDDFGTGYSSLSYLKNFPISTLKIDRSFIVDVTTSEDAAAITTAIVALAKAMDLDVVAEGVETKAQAAFLRARGCQKVQGFLFGRPAPAEAFTDYLRAHQGRRLVAGA